MHNAVFIFAGPSLFGSGLAASPDEGITWLPPARRGDVDSLVNSSQTPGVIGLADGTCSAVPVNDDHLPLSTRSWAICINHTARQVPLEPGA